MLQSLDYEKAITKSTKTSNNTPPIKAGLQIRKTYDYSLFSFYKSNRPVDHYKKIAESIQIRDLTAYNPILVDSDYNIIDGQNRYNACMSLRLPIYFLIIQDGSDKDIGLLNTTMVNFKPKDWLHYYCEKGNQQYINIRTLLNETDPRLLNFLVTNVASAEGSKIKGMNKVFMSGKVNLKKESFDKFLKVFHLWKETEDFCFPIPRYTTLLHAIWVIYDKIDVKRFIHQMQKYSRVSDGARNTTDCVLQIELVYNYNRKEKINLRY